MKKIILDNLRITIREVADNVGIAFSLFQAIFTVVLGMKCAAAKIVNFWAKTTSHGHCSGDAENVQRQSRFAQKGHNWWRIIFPLPKTEDTDERKAFCCDWGDRRKIEAAAVGDTKKRFPEVFRGLEKNAAISVLYLRGVTLKGQDSYW